ncbi:hypothetical protein [Parashewanella tropica]|uniref:hypothetical protein n=1 Tax=Parashewanella tropica TaxID=2547970 RepID=UPI00105A13C9|nr:hypothetical protein [Parashewanella tropica]
MSLSATFTEAFNFFKNHFKQLAIITVPFILIMNAIQMWIGTQIKAVTQDNPEFSSMTLAAVMALVIVFSWLFSSLTLFLEVRSQGHEPNARQIWFNALHFIPAMLLAAVFSGLAIAGPFFVLIAALKEFGALIGLAIALFIGTRLTYVNFMVVSERLTPMKAISSSWKLSGPIILPTLGIVMLYLPLSLIGGALSQVTSQVGMPLQLIVETAVAFFGLFINIALFRLYMLNRGNLSEGED